MKKTISAKNLAFCALCIALCVVLPMAFHAIANAGPIFLPMHIPVLLCGLACGWPYGLVSGLMMQLVHTKKLYADLYISQITAMLLGRILSGVCKALLFAPATFTVAAWATTSFVTGLPGIAIQLVLLPTLVVALTKARLLRVRYA